MNQTPGDRCYQIVAACHYVDLGVGEIHECHDLGHNGPESSCDEEVPRCVALCEAAAADAGSGGAGGNMIDGGHVSEAGAEGGVAAGGQPHAPPEEDAGMGTVTPPSRLCFDLSNLCHEADPGSGPIHECHEIGHDGDHRACVETWDQCVELCEAATP